jgi:hypothetical protein
MTKRTLRLRKDVLTELTADELGFVGGIQELTPKCPSFPLLTCLFVCTEV